MKNKKLRRLLGLILCLAVVFQQTSVISAAEGTEQTVSQEESVTEEVTDGADSAAEEAQTAEESSEETVENTASKEAGEKTDSVAEETTEKNSEEVAEASVMTVASEEEHVFEENTEGYAFWVSSTDGTVGKGTDTLYAAFAVCTDETLEYTIEMIAAESTTSKAIVMTTGVNITLTTAGATSKYAFEGEEGTNGIVYRPSAIDMIKNLGTLTIKNITFDGGSKSETCVWMAGGDSTTNILEGVVIQNFNDTTSSGVVRAGTCNQILNIDGVTFDNCSGNQGVVQCLKYGTDTVTISNTTFKDCKDTSSYGVIYQHGPETTLTLDNVVMENCSNKTSGAAVYACYPVTIKNSTFTNCSSPSGNGGAIYAQDELTLENVSFSGCMAATYGGAVYLTADATLTNCTFESCEASSGGAIYSTGTVDVTGSTFKNLVASSAGGSIYAPTINIKDSSISGSESGSSSGGSAIYATTSLTIENVEASDCTGGGAAFYDNGTTLTITGMTIDKATSLDSSDSGLGSGCAIKTTQSSCVVTIDDLTVTNSLSPRGGIVYLEQKTATLSNVTIKDCVSTTSGYDSGGGYALWNREGTMECSNVTVDNSGSADRCAGICNQDGTLTLTDCVVKGCATQGKGGGVCSSGDLYLNGVTITGNTAGTYGGGIYAASNVYLNSYNEEAPIVVSANTLTDGTASNLFEEAATYMIVDKALASGSKIGVTTKEAAIGTYNIAETQFGVANDTSDSNLAAFFCDVNGDVEACYSGSNLMWKEAGGICKIGDVVYESLQEAIDAINNAEATDVNGETGLTKTTYIIEMLTTSYSISAVHEIPTWKDITITTGDPYAENDPYRGGVGTTCTLYKATDYTDNMFSFTTGVFRLKDITIDNKNTSALAGYAVALSATGDLYLESGCTIQNWYGSAYGPVYVTGGGTVTMENGSLITNCKAKDGAAVSIYASMATMTMKEGAKITDCYADRGGGALYLRGKSASAANVLCMTMEAGSVIENCHASRSTTNGYSGGGAIYEWKNCQIKLYGTITDCTADKGGGIYKRNSNTYTSYSTSPSFSDTHYIAMYEGALIENCYATGTQKNTQTPTNGYSGFGGGIGYGNGGVFKMFGGTINNCYANDGSGGAVGGNNANVLMYDGALISNCTAAYAGGIFMSGNACFYGGTIENCTASGKGTKCTTYNGRGGALYLISLDGYGMMSYGLDIHNCYAATYGGGIYDPSSRARLCGISVVGCEAKTQGGGIYDSGTLYLNPTQYKYYNSAYAGTPIVIKANALTDGTTDNLFSKTKNNLRLWDNLAEGSNIGITTNANNTKTYNKVSAQFGQTKNTQKKEELDLSAFSCDQDSGLYAVYKKTTQKYIIWEGYNYTVAYDANGATGGSAPQDISVSKASSQEVVELKKYSDGDTVTVLGNVGSYNQAMNTSYPAGTGYFDGDVLTLKGYKFAGWNTAADGSGFSYAEGDTFAYNTSSIYVDSTTYTLTLYAQWQPLQVCKIGSTIYNLLQEALDAIADGTAEVSADGSYKIEMLVETYELSDEDSGSDSAYAVAPDGYNIIITTAAEDSDIPYRGTSGTQCTFTRATTDGVAKTGISCNGGSLTLENVTLSDTSSATEASSAYISATGTDLILSGNATIENCVSNGALLSGMKNVTMSGNSAIQNNTVADATTGFIVNCTGDFTMTDAAAIENNTASNDGTTAANAVVAKGTITLQDSVRVTGNTCNGTNGNVYLSKSQMIQCTGDGLTEGAQVGVKVVASDHHVGYDFAECTSEDAATTSAKYFSDDYAVSFAIDTDAENGKLVQFAEAINFSFTKVKDKDGVTAVEGAQFALYQLNEDAADREEILADTTKLVADSSDSWTLVGNSYVSDANGQVSLGTLAVGEYMLVETQAADNFHTPACQWLIEVSLTDDGYIAVTITEHGTENIYQVTFKEVTLSDGDEGEVVYRLTNHQTGFTLSYDGNGATEGETPEDTIVQDESTYTLDGNTGALAKTNAVWMGWSLTQTTTAITTQEEYDQAGVITEVTVAGDDITVYAVWAEDSNNSGEADFLETKYTLTYDANGAEAGTVPEAVEGILSGLTVELEDNTGELTMTKAVWVGWSLTQTSDVITTQSDEDAVVIEEIESFPKEDTTVYAVWGIDENEDGYADYKEYVDGQVMDTDGNVIPYTLEATDEEADYLYPMALDVEVEGAELDADGNIIVPADDDGNLPIGATITASDEDGDGLIDHVVVEPIYGDATTLYSIYFEANGGEGEVPETITGTYGTVVEIPDAGELTYNGENIVFAGWSTEETGVIEADGSKPENFMVAGTDYTLTEDVTLYAVWGVDEDGDGIADFLPKITLTYDGNGAEGEAPEAVTGVEGQKIIVSDQGSLSYTDAVFVGWTEEATGLIDANGSAPEGLIKAESLYTMGSEDSTLYAVWAIDSDGDGIADYEDDDLNGNDIPDSEETKMTVTYDANGAEGEAPEAVTGVVGQKIIVSDQGNLTYDGAIFIGWSETQSEAIDANGSEPDDLVSAGSLYTIGSDTTLYAVWALDEDGDGIPDYLDDEVKVTITVEHYQENLEDDGYTLAESENCTVDVGAILDVTANEYEGFTVNLELTTADGELVTDATVVKAGMIVRIYYERNIYTMTYMGNGNDQGPTEVVEELAYKYGAEIVVKSPEELGMAYTDHTFLYWEGSILNPGDTWIATSDKTLVAQWSADEVATATEVTATVKTGDTANNMLVYLLFGTAVTAIIAGYRRKEKRA